MPKRNHPTEIVIAIQTARDIASDENVNMEQAACYLRGAYPEYFASDAEAVDAITGRDQQDE